MEAFKIWLKKQNISAEAIESIVNNLKEIKRDFIKKKIYQYLFASIETNDVMKIIKLLRNDKFYMLKNHASKNSLNRSLDMYLRFIKYNKSCSEKDKQVNDARLTKNNSNVSQNSNEIKYKKVLKLYFTNGFRLNSCLELKKFMRRYYEVIGNEPDDDEKVTNIIKKIGIEYGGKAYLIEQMMNSSTSVHLMSYIQKLFDEGKKTIFYDSLFQKFKDDFQDCCMYNDNMLKTYLSYVNDGSYYIKRSYISADENDNVEPIDEIRECMIKNAGIYSYAELAELLPHIPVDKIKVILGSNEEFVRTKKGHYFHANIIDLSLDELNKIEQLIQDFIDDKGYITGKELCLGIKVSCLSAYEKMTAFSEIGIRKAIAYKLRKRFNSNGNIISDITKPFSMKDVYASYCKNRGHFTLNDLYELRDELGSGVIYFDAVYSNSVRVSETEFVSKNYVQFAVSVIDEIINKFCIKDYIPIGEITQFVLFPSEGYSWNSYLLEHYIYAYSYRFRLLNRGFNANKCVGVIVKKNSTFTEYDKVLEDAIAYSGVSLNCEDVLNYLYENGYIGRRKVSNIDTIITNAKNIRMQKG